MSFLQRHVPLIAQIREAPPGSTRGDVVAGLTTAVMLVPQAMAYAMLAGLPPIVGLYASTIPLFVYGLLGTSRQLAVGPVAMVSMLVAASVGAMASEPTEAVGLAVLLMLLVGLLQWGMGVARLGFLVKFLSHPVISGFTSAAAILIGLSQLGHVLGIHLPRGHAVHTLILEVVQRASEIHWLTVAVAVASMVGLVVMKRFTPRLPRFLIVVVGTTLAVWGLGLHESGVAIVGDVPGGLPTPSVPMFSLGSAWALLPTALTIALVGFMESISVAKGFARTNKYRVDADQELTALGLANVAGSFFGGYPVTGGFSRTAVNGQAGARTGLAGIITAAAIVVTLLFLTPMFHFLPKAALAAIILTAVIGLVDLAEVRHLWKVSRPDLTALVLTFGATLTLGIEPGILAGVAASLLWFVWKTSRPHVAVLGEIRGDKVYRNIERYPEARQTPGVVALRVDAPLYFANTAFLETTIEAHVDDDTTDLVLDCKSISSVDAQALSALASVFDALEDRGVTLWLAGLRGPVRDSLEAAELLERIPPGRRVERVHKAVDQIRPVSKLPHAV